VLQTPTHWLLFTWQNLIIFLIFSIDYTMSGSFSVVRPVTVLKNLQGSHKKFVDYRFKGFEAFAKLFLCYPCQRLQHWFFNDIQILKIKSCQFSSVFANEKRLQGDKSSEHESGGGPRTVVVVLAKLLTIIAVWKGAL